MRDCRRHDASRVLRQPGRGLTLWCVCENWFQMEILGDAPSIDLKNLRATKFTALQSGYAAWTRFHPAFHARYPNICGKCHGFKETATSKYHINQLCDCPPASNRPPNRALKRKLEHSRRQAAMERFKKDERRIQTMQTLGGAESSCSRCDEGPGSAAACGLSHPVKKCLHAFQVCVVTVVVSVEHVV